MQSEENVCGGAGGPGWGGDMVRDMAGGRKKAVVYQRGICRTWEGTSLDGGRLGGAVHSTQLRKGKAKGLIC